MTKAERIFNGTAYECRRHAKTWGFEYSENGKPVGYNGLITDEAVSTRTFNDVQKLIDKRRHEIDIFVKNGIYDADKYAFEQYVVEAVQVTLENNRKSYEKFNQMLNA